MKILFQGDSITDGGRIKDNTWDQNHQIGHSYAFFAAGYLQTTYYCKPLEIINRGLSGNRIADLYARIQEDIINLAPDVISILIGVNDVYHHINGGKGAPPAKFERVYRMLLEDIFESLPGSKIIICEPFVLPVGQVKAQWEAYLSVMTETQVAVRAVVNDFPVGYVPLHQTFDELTALREPEYWMWDGIHPTVAGHQMLAKEWLKVTEPIITQCLYV